MLVRGVKDSSSNSDEADIYKNRVVTDVTQPQVKETNSFIIGLREKQAKKTEFEIKKMLNTSSDSINFAGIVSRNNRATAMVQDDEEF